MHQMSVASREGRRQSTLIKNPLTHTIMKTLAANPRTLEGRIETAKTKVEQAIQKYGARNNKTIALQLAYFNLKLSLNK